LRVGFFITCLVDLMRPEIAESAVKLLEAAGCSVEVPMTQTCCGQPGFNSGDTPAARDLARKYLAEFERFEYVVVPSGSCGGMIRTHYPALFADDPDLRNRISAIAARTWELTSFLHDVLKVKSVPGGFQGEITYHDSCSGLRELGVQAQPRALLAMSPGVRLTEMKDARACCGFGGTFAVKYGDISTAIVDEKIERIRSSGAPCVVLGDLGCMLNIEGRLRRTGDTTTRVLHVAQVLAGDVPEPVAVAAPALTSHAVPVATGAAVAGTAAGAKGDVAGVVPSATAASLAPTSATPVPVGDPRAMADVAPPVGKTPTDIDVAALAAIKQTAADPTAPDAPGVPGAQPDPGPAAKPPREV
jgi:L-lactate dehydrogenase complex protein LldE